MNTQELRKLADAVIEASSSKFTAKEWSARRIQLREAVTDPHELLELLDKIDQLQASYDELIFAVARKFPDETRHQTALRYIKRMEEPETTAAMKE